MSFLLPEYFKQLSIMIGTLWLFNLCYHFSSKGMGRKCIHWASSSYFCYLLHQQILMFIKRGLYKTFNPHNPETMLMLYVAVPIITICICYFLYNQLHKRFPIVLSVILGEKHS